MTSLLLPATTTTTLLVLLSLYPFTTNSATTAYITDEDGEPMLNGGTYYILPQTTTNGGGLTVEPPNTASSCPFYINQESDPTSNGLPIKITSSINSKYLPFGSTVFSFANATTTTSCTEPLVWRAALDSATGHFYVAAGATQQVDPSAFNIIVPFNSVDPRNYQINICNKLVCASVGIYNENGLLGLNNDVHFAVRFRKAFHGSSESISVM